MTSNTHLLQPGSKPCPDAGSIVVMQVITRKHLRSETEGWVSYSIICNIDLLCPPVQRWDLPCWGTRLLSCPGWSRPTAPSVRGRGTSSGLSWLLLSSTMTWRVWRWPWGMHWGSLPAGCLPWRYSCSCCNISLNLRAQYCFNYCVLYSSDSEL